jgi:hypothetical protein
VSTPPRTLEDKTHEKGREAAIWAAFALKANLRYANIGFGMRDDSAQRLERHV